MVGHVIDFNSDGSAEAMHNDKFPLSMLGDQQIVRATEIKFVPASQTWSICEPEATRDDFGAYYPFANGEGFATYDGARKIEIAWLNACRLEGVSPCSEAGAAALRFIRGVTPPDL